MKRETVENIKSFKIVLGGDKADKHIGTSMSQFQSGNGILIKDLSFDFHLFHKESGNTESELFNIIKQYLFNLRPRISFGCILFENCEFKKGLSVDINKKLIFSNCVFKTALAVSHNIKDWLIFNENTTFEQVVINNTITAKLSFEDCIFNGMFSAHNATFENKVRIHNCLFKGDTDFRNTTFMDLADFWCSTFFKHTIFYKTDFFGTAVFSGVTFNENVLFTYSLIDKNLILKGAIPKKGFDLALSIFPGELLIFDFHLGDFKSETKTYRNQEQYDHDVSSLGNIPIKNKRETFRIFKQTFIKQNNVVESLPYQMLEKAALEEEYRLNKGVFNWVDKKILCLNKYSNNFGTSPLHGLVFITLFGWLFFYFSLIATANFSFEWNPSNWAFNDGVRYFFQFLIPTHRFDYLGAQTNGWFYVWDFFGRTFVGYGIYQFIQAFRKFR